MSIVLSDAKTCIWTLHHTQVVLEERTLKEHNTERSPGAKNGQS